MSVLLLGLTPLRIVASLSFLLLAAAILSRVSGEQKQVGSPSATDSEKGDQTPGKKSLGIPDSFPTSNRAPDRANEEDGFDRPFEEFLVERNKLLNNMPMAVDFSGRVTEAMAKALAMTDTEVLAVSATTAETLDNLKRAEASRLREPDETELAEIKKNLDSYGMTSAYQGKEIRYLPPDRDGKNQILRDLKEALEQILGKERTRGFMNLLRNEAVMGLSSIDQIFIPGGPSVRVQQWSDNGMFEYGRNHSGPSMERYSYLTE